MSALPILLALSLGAAPTPAPAVTSATSPGGDVLTLEHAQELAEVNNIDLQMARERLERAAILSKKAWAFILPIISANASVTRNNTAIIIPFGLPESLRPLFESFGQPFPPPQNVTIQELYNQNASASFSWSLLNGRSIPLIQNAYTSVEVANLSYAQTALAMHYATALTYYGVLNADRQVDIRRRALKLAEEHKKLADAQVSVGEATQVIALRADVEVATAQQALLQADNAAHVAHLALATLLGTVADDGTYPAYVVARPTETFATPEGDVLAHALEGRLDLKTSHLQLEMAERSKTESWMKLLPSLVASGAYRWSNAAGFSGEKTNWQLTLSLQWQIFEGGTTFWELHERQHDINTALLMIDKTRQQITQQVIEARLNVETAEANYTVAARRVDLAQKSAALVEAQYQVGAATQLDLLDATRALADAETAEALGQLGVDMAHMQLEQVSRIPTSAGGSGSNGAATASSDTSAMATDAAPNGM